MNVYVSMVILLLLNFVINSQTDPLVNMCGQSGLVSVNSAKTLGKTQITVSSYMDFASDQNYVEQVIRKNDTIIKNDTIKPLNTVLQFQPGIGYGLNDFWDIGVSIPVNFDIMENFSPQCGIGDLKICSKLRIPGYSKLNAALFSAMTIPTGSRSSGFVPRHGYYYKELTNNNGQEKPISYYTSKSFDFDIEALLTLNVNWLLFHLNTGCIFTSNEHIDNVLVLKGALELKPSKKISFFTELTSENRFCTISKKSTFAHDPIWITPGIAINTEAGAMVTLSGGISLTSKKNIDYIDKNRDLYVTSKMQPAWKIALQLAWSGALGNQDSDKDLVPDKVDKCPEQSEDSDGFEDSDGCPDLDNDKDGIIDSLDQCINEPEDQDGFEDEDGCPDLDNDKDGIIGSLDKCPDVPEDIDGFEDGDGCPDIDNDSDGVPDYSDKCINEPEDQDGFEDEDGCPDIDNDLDGIIDSLDKCPDVAGDKDEDGCPAKKALPKEIKIGRVILSGVGFEPKTAKIVQSAYRILDQLYESLSGYPSVKLEIHAHTDASGNHEKNIKLTIMRADTVLNYLVQRGISKERLISIGKGDTEPIADNSSILGRQLNNRIEIFRIE